MSNFKQDLAYSLARSDEDFWDKVYHKAFHNMKFSKLCDEMEKQRIGIDRIITLSSGKRITIDEKKRRKEYNDILLEYVSNDKRKTPGWVEKNLDIDYIAYAFMDSRKVYLFDFRMLQRAWRKFGSEWKEKYGTKAAQNQFYNTLSTPIPTNVLLKAVQTATIIVV